MSYTIYTDNLASNKSILERTFLSETLKYNYEQSFKNSTTDQQARRRRQNLTVPFIESPGQRHKILSREEMGQVETAKPRWIGKYGL